MFTLYLQIMRLLFNNDLNISLTFQILQKALAFHTSQSFLKNSILNFLYLIPWVITLKIGTTNKDKIVVSVTMIEA